MTTTKHTAEPWEQGKEEAVSHYIFATRGDVIVTVATAYNTKLERAEDIAARIVECVNACAGMEDPAAAIEKAKEALRLALSTARGTRVPGAHLPFWNALRALGD